jgi:hypothetical protein
MKAQNAKTDKLMTAKQMDERLTYILAQRGAAAQHRTCDFLCGARPVGPGTAQSGNR